MDPYAPPKHEAVSAVSEDADLQAVTPTRMTQVAGGVAIGTGLYTLLLALQTAAAVRFSGLMNLIVPLMTVLGAVLLVCGWSLRRYRGWAAMAATVVSGLTGLVGAVWFVLGLSIGLLTFMPLIVVVAAIAACALASLQIGPARRADAARKRLAEQGMSF